MRGYIIKRLLLGIPTILGAMLLIFTIMRVIPGDVAVLIAVGGSEGVRLGDRLTVVNIQGER